MAKDVTRRDVLKAAGAAAMGLTLGGASFGATPRQSESNTPASQPPPRKRVLRIAHLTDIHVQPEKRANEGMIACLHHVQNLPDKPELILTGGDSIMDSFEADDARTQLQWDLFRKILKDECCIPIEHCIGNHDIWGWNKSASRTTGREPNYGKKRALEMFGLAERYRGFSPAGGGWRFIVLDSTQPPPGGGDGYRAFLDAAQLDWLQRELASIDSSTSVLLLSHIPIVAASAIIWAAQNERGDYAIDGSLIHQDAKKIIDLFARHANVKLCLSGHLHHVDRVDYNGVSYLCNGAVCGNWWKGRHKHCDEGYAVIDLYSDGSFVHEYVKYGWREGPA